MKRFNILVGETSYGPWWHELESDTLAGLAKQLGEAERKGGEESSASLREAAGYLRVFERVWTGEMQDQIDAIRVGRAERFDPADLDGPGGPSNWTHVDLEGEQRDSFWSQVDAVISGS